MAPNVIYFYHQTDSYGFLSNFYAAPIEVNGVVYPTSEHFFQAQKFSKAQNRQKVIDASTPMIAKRLGRQAKLREDWEQVKDGIMFSAVHAKFLQHDDLRMKLLATGTSELVEHTYNDSYWGDGGTGKGLNMLGKTLMCVREELSR